MPLAAAVEANLRPIMYLRATNTSTWEALLRAAMWALFDGTSATHSAL